MTEETNKLLSKKQKRRIGIAILIGAFFGVLSGYEIGAAFGEIWVSIFVVGGAIVGGIAGLDLLLPRPKSFVSDHENEREKGPFTTFAYFVVCLLIALAGGVYFGNAHAQCELQRLSDGSVVCRQVVSLFYGLSEHETIINNVKSADVTVHDEVMLRTEKDLPDILSGVPGRTAESINSFIASKEKRLQLAGSSWWRFVSPGFYLVAAIMLWLCGRTLRSAIYQLNTRLHPRTRSATAQ